MKKFIIGAAMLALAATSLFAEGKVLNVYCWNDEFASRFNDYYKAKNPKALEGVTVNFIQTPNQGSAYQDKLTLALLKNEEVKVNDRVDLFLVEADYAVKFTKEGYALDVIKDIGLTKKDLANQYQYTKDVVTDSKKVLRGVSWQACPSGMIYRRSYAKALFGTDDPAKVQEKVSDWSKFNAVAAQAKAKGYYMVSGYDDTYRIFDDNRKSAWVKGNKIVVDPAINTWISQTKEFTDKGYNNKTSLWAAEWSAGMMKDGNVFAYFGPGWLIDFCMAKDDPASAANAGDWGFCEGPQGFSWGGTWICAANGTDNIALIRDIMKTLTCDQANMTNLAKETGDFANNVPAMTALANDKTFHNSVLGGQNPYALLLKNAQSISKNTISKYDQGMSENIQAAMKDYYEGKVTLDEAWDNFYTSVIELYPNLKR